MKNKLWTILVTGFFLVGLAGMASATLLTNGSFEDYTNFVNEADGTMVLNAGDTELTNWVVTGEIAWIGPSNPFSLTASDGDYFLDLTAYPVGGSGGVAQTSTATVSGQSYTLMFDLGASTSYGNPTQIIATASAGSTTQTFNATATSTDYWQTCAICC